MDHATRFGVIGGGIRGSMFASVIAEHPGAELVGFCDPSPATADRIGREFSVPVHGAVEKLLDEGVDAVVVATPDFAHLDVGLAALERNLHVLFEKPLATTRGDARQLRDAALASDGRVMVGFENRWNPKFQQVRHLLERSGSAIVAQRVLLQDTEFVPRQMLGWAGRSTPGWFLFPHTLDLAMWLSGTRPVEVFARGVKKVLAADGIDTYDRIAASFRMSDNSILDLDSGWVLPESRPAVFQFRYGIEAHGLEFDIEIDRSGVTTYDSSGIHYLSGPDKDARGRLLGPHIDMMRDFIDFCDGAKIEAPDVTQGFAVTEAIATLHDALDSGTNLPITY